MTYSTPELLMIGAARNVVMDDKDSTHPECLVEGGRSWDPELW